MTNAERIRAMSNEELVQVLRNCSSVDGECEGCPMYNHKDALCKVTNANEVMRLTADRLEALTERNNGWVPVTERLPAESGTYLVNVHQKNDDRSSDCVLEAWYWADKPLFCPDSVGWHMLNEFYPYSDTMRNDITHWMPWPEPPEVDE